MLSDEEADVVAELDAVDDALVVTELVCDVVADDVTDSPTVPHAIAIKRMAAGKMHQSVNWSINKMWGGERKKSQLVDQRAQDPRRKGSSSGDSNEH